MKRILRSSLLIMFAALLVFVLATKAVNSEPPLDGQTRRTSEPIAVGEIDYEIFSRSVPKRMTVGETYTILLVVTNTGNITADFLVYLYFPFQTSIKYFYSLDWIRSFTLRPGESHRAEFYVTPVDDHIGPLVFVGKLYSLLPDRVVIKLVDNASATVYEIRTTYPVETTIWIIGFVVFLGIVALAVRFGRKRSDRRELIIASVLFSVALLLRASDLLRVAVYPDETTFELEAYQLLHYGLRWTERLMWEWGCYPPLIQYLYAIWIYLFGTSLEASRTVSVVSGSLTIVVVYFLGKSVFDNKVGLLSALFLCFSSFHILYSRLATSESLVLFFILTALYFFWVGYNKKSRTYMCMSGIFFGLSLNTKYIALAAALASVLFIAWIERSWKPLVRKDFLIWLATILLVISPVQLSLILNEVSPCPAWGQRAQIPERVSRSLFDIVPRGIRDFVYLLARAASPWLPWLRAYELSILTLSLAAILYHIYPSLIGRINESFLLLSLLAPVSFTVISPLRHIYWLIYALPYCLIMLANLTIRYACSLRVHRFRSAQVKKGLKETSFVLKVFVLLFVAIFVFTNTMVGAMVSSIDAGEFEGNRLAMSYVKSRVGQGEVISGWWASFYIYYINQYDLNVTFVPLERVPPEMEREALVLERPVAYGKYTVNEQVLTILKPRFIIISREYLEFYFNTTMKEVLQSNYRVVWTGKPLLGYSLGYPTRYQIWVVFERRA